MLSELVLALMLIVSVFNDVRDHRIPNWVTIPGIVSGLALQGFYGGTGGLLAAAGGAAAGAALLIIPYLFNLVGGGDIKLLAAIGALMGASFTVLTLFFALAAGAVHAVGWLIVARSFVSSVGYMFLVWLPQPREKPIALSAPIPFGPALAVGALVAAFWQ